MIRFLHCAKFFCSPSLGTFLSLAPSLSQFTHNAPKEYTSLCFSLSRGFVMKGGKSKAGADSKLGVRKKATETKKAKKAAKDPNKPKRPPSAFFVFMEEFRKTYKEKHPNNKSVAAVGKAGGDAWKKLSDAEKAPYQAKAEKRKAEYQKNMDAYNRKQAGDAEEEESDKSKSEVHDDDEDDDGSEEEEDDD
ncbi:PREDICTED: HMG1/2-like protein [Nicotiana attenuata]|uniref:HMG1/2-like protein n=1 Tax=Nicotiana attenuata TaxID=49451 RepID=UPI00090550D0|nr:PREDICTED: HMG1/2-like protein [Nicotiana attenuata]